MEREKRYNEHTGRDPQNPSPLHSQATHMTPRSALSYSKDGRAVLIGPEGEMPIIDKQMPRPRMRRRKDGVLIQEMASGDTLDYVSWPDFHWTIEEKIQALERRMRVHERKWNKKIEEISNRTQNLQTLKQ